MSEDQLEQDTKPLPHLHGPIDVEECLENAPTMVGLRGQERMIEDTKAFINELKDYLVPAAKATREGDAAAMEDAFNDLVGHANENDLAVEWVSPQGPDNPAHLERRGNKWVLQLDPKLDNRKDKLLREVIHELGAWWLIKKHKLNDQSEIESADNVNPSHLDFANRHLGTTHLIDGVFLLMSGQRKFKA